MTIIQEYEHLIALSPDNAIRIVSDAEALAERLYEWLETPEGTLADLPGWGNNLSIVKHESPSFSLNVAVEILLMQKLPEDIKDIKVSRVGVDFSEIDHCTITIEHQFGTHTQAVTI